MTILDFNLTLLSVFLSLFMVMISAQPMAFRVEGRGNADSYRLLTIWNILLILWVIADLGMRFASNPSVHGNTMYVREALLVAGCFMSIARMGWERTMDTLAAFCLMTVAFFVSRMGHDPLIMAFLVGSAFLSGNLKRFRKNHDSSLERYHDEIIKSIEDHVVILDARGRTMAICGPLKDLWDKEGLPEGFRSPVDAECDVDCEVECDVDTPDGRIRMLVRRNTLFGRNGKPIGEIVVGHDITRYHELRRQMDEEAAKLSEAVEALRSYGHVHAALVVEQEKRAFVEQVDSEVGQEMVKLLQVIRELIETDNGTLDSAIGMGRTTIARIRGTARRLMEQITDREVLKADDQDSDSR